MKTVLSLLASNMFTGQTEGLLWSASSRSC